jgi:HSP20 family protein
MSGNGRTLTRPSLLKPTVFDELFKPWTQLFDDRWPSATQLPAVNIRETENEYEIRLAAPGLEKNDFKIDVNDTLITISAEKEEKKLDIILNISFVVTMFRSTFEKKTIIKFYWF